MEFTYRTTTEDQILAERLIGARILPVFAIMTSIFMLCLVAQFFVFFYVVETVHIVLAIVGNVLCFRVLMRLKPPAVTRDAKEMKFVGDAREVRLIRDDGESRFTWSLVKGIRETDTHLRIERLASYWVIPKRDLTQSQIEEFKALARHGMAEARDDHVNSLYAEMNHEASAAMAPGYFRFRWLAEEAQTLSGGLHVYDTTHKVAKRSSLRVVVGVGLMFAPLFFLLIYSPAGGLLSLLSFSPILFGLLVSVLQNALVRTSQARFSEFMTSRDAVLHIENGFIVHGTQIGTDRFKLSSITQVLHNARVIALVFHGHRVMVPVPKRVIGDDAHVEDFVALVGQEEAQDGASSSHESDLSDPYEPPRMG